MAVPSSDSNVNKTTFKVYMPITENIHTTVQQDQDQDQSDKTKTKTGLSTCNFSTSDIDRYISYLDIVSALTVGGHLLSLVRRCLTLCQMIYEILQSAHRPSDSRWRLVFSLPISTFSALGVSHVMRSINVRYLLTYLLRTTAVRTIHVLLIFKKRKLFPITALNDCCT